MSDPRPRAAGMELARVLLRPQSVALIGASDDPAKTAGRPLQFLRRAGYAGTVYPINPKRQTVQGEHAWPGVDALPERPEHAFILTPTDGVAGAVRDCVDAGVPIVTVLASGFSEAGAEGSAKEAQLRELCNASGTRLLGPSSLGVVCPDAKLVLTANAVFAEPGLPAGGLFVASHSGSMIGALVSRGKARGVGFAGLVSVGGEADLSLGEICEATLDDPTIEGYLLFLESLRHGHRMESFARRAADHGKPVIAYKLGRSAAAAEMATTHTGALAGEDDVADAFLKDLGIVRVEMLDSLIETFPLARQAHLLAHSSFAARRVGVITTTGGGAATVVDQLGVRGVNIERASNETLAKLRGAGVPATPGRVLDMTLAGTRPDVMGKALDVLTQAPEFDLVLVVVGSSARTQPHLAVEPLLACPRTRKPVVAMLVPIAPHALETLTAAGVPCFQTPEVCADAIAAVLARRKPNAPRTITATHTFADARIESTARRTWSEAQAYDLLDDLGVPHAPAITFDLAMPPAALPFDFPVAAKVCSDRIPHKTEVEGVVLAIRSVEELAEAFARLRANLARNAPGIACHQALVQPMRSGLAEVLIGYRVDPDAGPLVMVATGGVWTEVFRDRSIRLAPVDIATAREMIEEVKSLKTVSGLRGRPRGDLDALARAILALSRLAQKPELEIIEAEINPLIVMPAGEGVAAVDALVVQAGDRERR